MNNGTDGTVVSSAWHTNPVESETDKITFYFGIVT